MTGVLTDRTNSAPVNNQINTPSSSKVPIATGTDELIKKRRCFATYTFYLDNLDAHSQKRIERGIKLLGASVEAFFSNKCTHIITNKPIPEYDNFLNNVPNCPDPDRYKTSPREAMIEKAIEWGKTLWSTDVMLKTVEILLHTQGRKAPQAQAQPQQKRKLDAMLKEEKLQGTIQAAQKQQNVYKKLKYKPFTGHYLIVEDAQQIYRPPVIKVYTDELITTKQSAYPWPYLKHTPRYRSPFSKKSHTPVQQQQQQQKPTATAVTAREDSMDIDDENVNDENKPYQQQQIIPAEAEQQFRVQPQQQQQAKAPLVDESNNYYESNQAETIYNHTYNTAMRGASTTTTVSTTSTPKTAEYNQTLLPAQTTHGGSTSQNTQKELEKPSAKDPTLQMLTKRMIELPKTTAATSSSASPAASPAAAPALAPALAPAVSAAPVAPVARAIVVPNTSKIRSTSTNLITKTPTTAAAAAAAAAAKELDNEKKKNYKFCENCNKVFESYEEHIKEKKHIEFVLNEENWAALDELIESTTRH